jgi:hypothetical protein
MLIRKLIAITTLAAGLGGGAVVATNLATIIGSTSTAGAPSVCFKKAVCGSGAPQPSLLAEPSSPAASTDIHG